MQHTPDEIKTMKIRQSLKRRLWAAMIAEDSFRKVQFSAQYYIDNAIHTTHPLHYTFLSSIVVNYCKIFSGGNVVPTLPEKFTKFDDVELQLAHDALLIARNNIYAHPDSRFMRYKLTANVWIESPTRTGMKLDLNSPHLNDGNIPFTVKLCTFQLARLIPYRENLAYQLIPAENIYRVCQSEHSMKTTINISWPAPTDTPGMW